MRAGAERPRLICRCLGVASPRVYAAVRDQKLDSVAAITKAVRAGGGCTLCHPELQEVLAEVRGEPVEPWLALENQMVCREETRSRVAGSIESLVRPRLARLGIALAEYEIEGLCVRVRLAGPDDDATLVAVRDQLRRYVCPDLEVERL
jgi:bacterioferritin-associated ferredoxin